MLTEADVLKFAADKSPKRILVYNARRELLYKNPSASKYLEQYQLPEELHALTERLFSAMARKNAALTFPGHICFSKEIGARRWVFSVAYREDENPIVCIYFSSEAVSDQFDLNALRQQYRLTRRETAVLRHVLDGLNNQEISEELGIAVQTVKDHLSAIYGKHGVQDRFSLLRHLLVSP